MKKIIVFLVMLFLLILVVVYSLFRLYPVIYAQADARAKNIALEIISDSVADTIKEKGTEYYDLVEIQRDKEGNVASLSSRVESINLFKSGVSKRILEKISDVSSREFGIPLGNLSGNVFLSGRGPALKVRIIEATCAQSEITSLFEEAGINQTRHILKIEIKIRMQIVVLTSRHTVETSDSIVIADTVIVGKVPDGYTAINKADNELIGDIVDFRAE